MWGHNQKDLLEVLWKELKISTSVAHINSNWALLRSQDKWNGIDEDWTSCQNVERRKRNLSSECSIKGWFTRQFLSNLYCQRALTVVSV